MNALKGLTGTSNHSGNSRLEPHPFRHDSPCGLERRVTGSTHEHLEGDDALLHLLALEAG
jgi:hypothetical protein